MPPIVREHPTQQTPDSLAAQLAGAPGRVLLWSASPDAAGGRYSFVTANPFLTFESCGAHCVIQRDGATVRLEGDPWRALEMLMARYELIDDLDLPFPLGGAFGFWGYDLRHFVEPRLPRPTTERLDLPDCHLGFYSSVVVFDHHLGRTWILSTGVTASGARDDAVAEQALAYWSARLQCPPTPSATLLRNTTPGSAHPRPDRSPSPAPQPRSSLDRARFIAQVRQAQRYIRAGHIYQVNLAQRLSLPFPGPGFDLFRALTASSPMPYAAYLEGRHFEVISASPELFLRLSGAEIVTRPIKGTRPRSPDPHRDAQLAFELQTSPKERAELVMITDLLRNDLGRVCEYGSVHVPDLARLERYPYVQHLVSTVTGRLRPGLSHLEALAACFPGGSVTGAPKVRAMEIIDELEPVGRGPYTGCLGYLGFNRESQLSIIIRTACLTRGTVHFHTGAGIVADSDPEAEYEETLHKARGFLASLPSAAAGQAIKPSPPCPPACRHDLDPSLAARPSRTSHGRVPQ